MNLSFLHATGLLKPRKPSEYDRCGTSKPVIPRRESSPRDMKVYTWAMETHLFGRQKPQSKESL